MLLAGQADLEIAPAGAGQLHSDHAVESRDVEAQAVRNLFPVQPPGRECWNPGTGPERTDAGSRPEGSAPRHFGLCGLNFPAPAASLLESESRESETLPEIVNLVEIADN